MTTRDEHVRISVHGGVGSMTLNRPEVLNALSHDMVRTMHLQLAFARRIARNTQSLLVEDGSLARVLDPAGGFRYVEALTEDLAQAAWAWFTEIERAGGPAARDSGLVADRIGAAWAERSQRLASRAEAITGVSQFPNPAEVLPARRQVAPPPTGGLPRVRAAGAFEELRDRVEAVGPRRGSTSPRWGHDGGLHLRDGPGLCGVRRRSRRGAPHGRGHERVARRSADARSGRRRRVRVRRM